MPAQDGPPAAQPSQVQLQRLSPDQLVSVIFRLAMEISVLRERLHTHEQLLRQAGVFSDQAVDDHVPDQDAAQACAKARGELIANILKDLS